MITDGAGKEIVLGKKYGYSINSNGSIHSVVGIADKINELKVTLRDIEERSGINGELNYAKNASRKRAAYAAACFK
jgi:hypothetical protein